MDLKTRLEQANQRIKDEGYRITIGLNRLGNLLVLRGVFPPKPDADKQYPYHLRNIISVRENEIIKLKPLGS